MATSGSFGMSGGGYNSTFSWSLNSQSIANNSSEIGWWWDANWAGTTLIISSQAALWVDGGEVFRNAYNTSRRMYGGRQASGTRTIGHNSNGTRGFGASGEAAFYQYALNAWGSGSWDLPTIPRHGNITNVSGNINDETTNPWIEFSNPAGGNTEAFFELPDLTGTTRYAFRSGIGSRYTWTLSEAEKNALRAAMPNKTSTKLRYVYGNYVGGYWVHRTWDATISIINANPVFTDFNYKDNSSTVVAITGNDQVLVQGKSTLLATITTAQKMVAKKSATPSTYSFQFGSANVSAAYSATAAVSASLGAAASNGVQRLTVRAHDSRSNSASAFKDITVIPYATPIINATVERENGFEAQTTLSIAGSFSLVKVNDVTKNAVSTSSGVKYRYKRSDTSTWGNWTNVTASVASDGKITVADILMNNDNNHQWDFEVSITDKFGTTTTALTLSVGIPVFYIDKDGYASMNGMPDKTRQRKGLFIQPNDLLFDLIYPVGSIYMSVNSVNPSTLFGGTWVPFAAGRTIVGVDTTQTEFNAVEKTGGSKTVTLNVNQIPSHSHALTNATNVIRSSVTGGSYSGGSVTFGVSNITEQSVGGSQSHSNLQPFVTTYLWKRVS